MPQGQESASAFYESLIERDLEAIPAAARQLAASQSPEQLWVAVSRFAVLAYAPSQHAKRALIACSAVDELRDEARERWIDFVIECARYAAESRQPWSEPPLLDPPDVDAAWHPGAGDLRDAVAAGDRNRAEQWLAARLGDAGDDLRGVSRGDALLVTDAVLRLAPRLGEKGRYALLRVAVWELLANEEAGSEAEAPGTERSSIEDLVARAIAEKGAVDAVREVFLYVAASPELAVRRRLEAAETLPLAPYRLARDYAQTLIAHAIAGRLPAHIDVAGFLHAVHENLEHGESYADWSFA
jgi:hypothetical protein